MHLPSFKIPKTLLPVNKSLPIMKTSSNQHSESTSSKPPINPSSLCSACASRPPIPRNPSQTTAQTRYIDMLLSLDSIPRSHNLLAAFCTWILLAGFLIVPGTFTSMKKSKMIEEHAKQNAVANEVYKKIQHAPLMWIAFGCCVIGASGLSWLWWRWRRNYVWLINKIFLVGLLNSIAGLISTLINVYSQQGGKYSITAKVTVMVTSSCTVLMSVLFFLYNNWILQNVKESHQKELGLEVQEPKDKKALNYVQSKVRKQGVQPERMV